MQQNQNKGAVLKGLAFPIGYFLFMMIFQNTLLFAYVFFCMLRDIFIPVASAATSMEHFAQLISEINGSAALETYLNESLLPELSGAPTYFLSVLTSIIAILVLWLVFNRKNRDFKTYFGFKPTSFRAIAAGALLGLGFYFLVNAVLTVINMFTTVLALEWLIPAMRDMAEQMLQSGQDTMAELLSKLAETLESTLTAPAIVPPLSWFALAAIIFAPVVEEMIFRAGAIANLRKKLPVAITILLSSLLFSLAHMASFSLSQLIYTFILGAVAALLYLWSDSIYPAIICHFCFNGANIVTLAIFKLFSLEFIESTEQGNTFFGNYFFAEPNPDVLLGWGNALTLLFLFATAVLSIPMLIVGVFLLLGLRPSKKKAVQASAPLTPTVSAPEAPVAQQLTTDEPQVIAAEPSLGELTAEEAPAEDAPAKEAPVEDAPAKEAPVEDAPAEDAPVEDAPAEDAPVEDAPAEEAPAEDTPAEDTPAEDTLAEDTLVEKTPADSEADA